jgi:hypothetical protein
MKKRNLSLISKTNVKLFKKCLSITLFNINNIKEMPNLIFSKSGKIPVKILKKIYYRKELIPLRLLRFLLVLNFTKLIKNGIKFIVNKKLSVYNGRINKFININRGLLEITLKCKFKYGSLIFSREQFKFKKKKKKGKKK